MSVILALLLTLRSCARSRAVLLLEVLALRHQLQVLQRTRPPRVRLEKADRRLWMSLSRVWADWRSALVILKPETVIAWHRRGFQMFWTWKSHRRTGRPTVPADVRVLIRTMSQTNPRWGAPRIHGELFKLGIDVESPRDLTVEFDSRNVFAYCRIILPWRSFATPSTTASSHVEPLHLLALRATARSTQDRHGWLKVAADTRKPEMA
jgi:hypothetical protein